MNKIKKKIGIILNNDKFGFDKDYRIFDWVRADKGEFILLSQQGYKSLADAYKDAKSMGIKIKRKFEL